MPKATQSVEPFQLKLQFQPKHYPLSQNNSYLPNQSYLKYLPKLKPRKEKNLRIDIIEASKSKQYDVNKKAYKEEEQILILTPKIMQKLAENFKPAKFLFNIW